MIPLWLDMSRYKEAQLISPNDMDKFSSLPWNQLLNKLYDLKLRLDITSLNNYLSYTNKLPSFDIVARYFLERMNINPNLDTWRILSDFYDNKEELHSLLSYMELKQLVPDVKILNKLLFASPEGKSPESELKLYTKYKVPLDAESWEYITQVIQRIYYIYLILKTIKSINSKFI
jgi:hypothetical protein